MRHIMLMIGLKALLDGSLEREAARERNRDRILAELSQRAFGAGDEA